MTLVGRTVLPLFITANHIRRFLQDYPNKNKLIDSVEFSDEDINQAMTMVTSRYNAMTPQTSMASKDWPEHLQYPLLQALAGYLLKSSAFLQLRNQLTYQDGDIAPVGVDDKFPLYLQFAQQLEQDAMQTFMQIKAQNNLEGMYGGLGSSYAWGNRYKW